MKFFEKLRLFPLLFFMMSTLISCIYKDVEVVRLENVIIKKISSKGIEAEVFLKVKNPNKYNISIVDSDLDLMINDKPVGKARIADKITFAKNSEDVHRFTIESSFENLGGGILASFGSVLFSQSVNLGIKGDITAKALLMQKKLRLDIKENVGFTRNNLF